uniref:Putative secreted peptide n=1 Tax=Anopheles braziliensis TaxID=58242 RepID=A0A2M3ZMW8_9DIPT
MFIVPVLQVAVTCGANSASCAVTCPMNAPRTSNTVTVINCAEWSLLLTAAVVVAAPAAAAGVARRRQTSSRLIVLSLYYADYVLALTGVYRLARSRSQFAQLL